jgi:hypothetical protein
MFLFLKMLETLQSIVSNKRKATSLLFIQGCGPCCIYKVTSPTPPPPRPPGDQSPVFTVSSNALAWD